MRGEQIEKPVRYSFNARGHPSVVSTHPTTLEITKDPHLTRRGDCIVAVSAESGLSDVPSAVKKTLSSSQSAGRLTIKVQDQSFSVEGKGSEGLSFTHPTEMVVRKSAFVSHRTLMVHCDKAASDIPRKMVKLLQDPNQTVTIEISIIRPGRP
jgi:hypothetical protein